MHDECPCGARKQSSRLTCPECWTTSDLRLRRMWGLGTAADQRGRARELLRHARGRRPATPKPPKQIALL